MGKDFGVCDYVVVVGKGNGIGVYEKVDFCYFVVCVVFG